MNTEVKTMISFNEFKAAHFAAIIEVVNASDDADVAHLKTWAIGEVSLSAPMVQKRNLAPGMASVAVKIREEVKSLFPEWEAAAKERFVTLTSRGASAFDAPLGLHYPEAYLEEGNNRKRAGNALRRVEDFLKSHDGTWEDLIARVTYLNVVTS
jgi:hypothetical protein